VPPAHAVYGSSVAVATLRRTRVGTMSEDELVAAYTAGNLSRRAFVRRLVTRGVPLAAAVAYASALAPGGGPSWVPPRLRTVAASATTGSPVVH